MIRRPDVFDDDTVPPTLRHREGQVQELIGHLLRARARGDQGVLLTGPSGVGKTALGRTVLEQFATEYGCAWAWVETLGMSTGDVFREAIRAAGGDVRQNTPNAELPERLRETLDEDLFLLLDEGDDLAGAGTVWQLASIPGVHVVIVVHDADDWLARADHRVRQRLHGGRIDLSRYGVAELANILQDRARVGLVDNAVSREQLEAIADDVAGVAREGIQTLRAAAELAGERGDNRIRDGDVDEAHDRALKRIRASKLSSLPMHHTVLYELIREAGEITARELHARYEKHEAEIYAGHHRTPVGRRSRRNKLDKLIAYGLVEREQIDHRWLYSAVDETLSSHVELLEPRAQSGQIS